ncbi:MAG: hypothetical protein LBP54_02345 [Campylobacteraceae bacterium]|nr:hypothetical protein [Campylobacteraceae bacterium]
MLEIAKWQEDLLKVTVLLIIAFIICILFFRIIAGIALIILGIWLEIVWLGICFGSIILGIVLLLCAPHILTLPLIVCEIGLEVMKGN